VVLQASSVKEAVVLLETARPDVVLADVHMPGASGLELLKIFSRSAGDTPIIFLTGGPTMEDGVKAVEMGAYRYLTKPISLRDLEAVIQSALTDRRRARSSEPGRED
jgi:DNA-binding response OmpR family regulator